MSTPFLTLLFPRCFSWLPPQSFFFFNQRFSPLIVPLARERISRGFFLRTSFFQCCLPPFFWFSCLRIVSGLSANDSTSCCSAFSFPFTLPESFPHFPSPPPSFRGEGRKRPPKHDKVFLPSSLTLFRQHATSVFLCALSSHLRKFPFLHHVAPSPSAKGACAGPPMPFISFFTLLVPPRCGLIPTRPLPVVQVEGLFF